MSGQQDSNHFLQVAQGHLAQVQSAALIPDWDELSKHGRLCLEALIRAIDCLDGKPRLKSQWELDRQARGLALRYPLPDITVLLENLSDAQTGETEELSAPDIAAEIEDYFDSVFGIVSR